MVGRISHSFTRFSTRTLRRVRPLALYVHKFSRQGIPFVGRGLGLFALDRPILKTEFLSAGTWNHSILSTTIGINQFSNNETNAMVFLRLVQILPYASYIT